MITQILAHHPERAKRLTRAKARDMSVSDACRTIMKPPSPLALRLAAILLKGVVTLYNRKILFLHDDCRDVVQRLVQIQSRHAKKKRADVALLLEDGDLEAGDDVGGLKSPKKKKRKGANALNEQDLLEFDLNLLKADRGDVGAFGGDDSMSEFNAAPSGSRAISAGGFYLKDEEVLNWARNASSGRGGGGGESDSEMNASSKQKSAKRMQQENSRKAKLLLDNDDMMYRHGFGGNVDDDEVSGDEEAIERKRQRRFGMDDEDDEDANMTALAPIPDGESDEDEQIGLAPMPMGDSEEENAFLDPAFQSQKEQETHEERLLYELRAANAPRRPKQQRPKVARLANQRTIIFDAVNRVDNDEYKRWLKNCNDLVCERPKKEIPFDEMDIHLMNDEKALAAHFRATAFQTGRESFLRKGDRWSKFEAALYPDYKSKVNFGPIAGDATLVPAPKFGETKRPDGDYTTEDEDNAYAMPPAWDDEEEDQFFKLDAGQRAAKRAAVVRTPSSGGVSLRGTRGGSVVRTPSSLADALEGKELEFMNEQQQQGNLHDDAIPEDREMRSFSREKSYDVNDRSQATLKETEEEAAGYLDASGRDHYARIPRAAKNLLVFLSSNTTWSQDDDDAEEEEEEEQRRASEKQIDLSDLCESNALTRQAAARCFYNVLILQSEAILDCSQQPSFDFEDISSIRLKKGARYASGLAAALST